MKIQIVYVFPNLRHQVYLPAAQRFVQSYLQNPPGFAKHAVQVVTNGAPLDTRLSAIFEPLKPQFSTHDNSGKDIGAFLQVAKTLESDLMICLGSHVHFHRSGWLDHLLESYFDQGPGLYGCWGFHEPSPHLRTTAFWLPPSLLASYPYPVNNGMRYQFEHGRNISLFSWVRRQGLTVGQVSWAETRMFPNFFHVTSNDSLMLDQHTDRRDNEDRRRLHLPAGRSRSTRPEGDAFPDNLPRLPAGT